MVAAVGGPGAGWVDGTRPVRGEGVGRGDVRPCFFGRTELWAALCLRWSIERAQQSTALFGRRLSSSTALAEYRQPATRPYPETGMYE